MNTELKPLPHSKAELTISVTKDELAEYEDQTVQKVGKEVTIQGFRPGKAPKQLIIEKVGRELFERELLETAIALSFYKAVSERSLPTIAPPEVQLVKFVPGQELEYKATVILMPEVKLPDFSKINVEKKTEPVTDEEVGQFLESLRKQEAVLKPKEGEAAPGDRAEIDLEGVFEGKVVPQVAAKHHPLIVGEKTLFPEVHTALLGMKKGEAKTINVSVPAEYRDKELAGKTVAMTVTLNLLHTMELPELNDDFAKTLGLFETLPALKADAREKIKAEKERRAEAQFEEAILEALIQAVKLDLPPELVAQEKDHLVENLKGDVERQGMTMEQFLAGWKKTAADLQSELEKEAERRLTVSLLLTELAKREAITVSDEELDEVLERYAERFGDKKEEAKGALREEDQLKQIRSQLITQKTIARLKELIGKENVHETAA